MRVRWTDSEEEDYLDSIGQGDDERQRVARRRWRRQGRTCMTVAELQRLVATARVTESGMSVPGSRKGSGAGDDVYQEVADILTQTHNGVLRSPSSYDLISRTIHQLAREGNSEILAKALGRLGESGRRCIDALDRDKLAPLHYAARYAHTNTVRTLIHAGAQVNILGQERLTPLHYAARYRKQLKPSRKLTPAPSPSPPSKLIENEEEGEEEEEEKEEEEGEEKEEEEDEGAGEEQGEEGGEEGAEEPTVKAEHIEMEELENKNNLTITSNQSWQVGGGLGLLAEDSVIKVLVENGAEVNARDIYGQTPLHFAAMRGNDPAARDLLMCPQVMYEARDKQLMTPLYVAATYGYVDICRRLIRAGSSLLSKDETQQTPLHRAAMEGHVEIVSLLLESAREQGGEELVDRMVGEQDSEWQTALHLAVHNGHQQVVQQLLIAKSEVNAMRDTQARPLHAAAAVGDTGIIALLLQHHARLDCVDSYQQTPLHRAAAHNQPQALQLLLDAGANIEQKDKDSFTPLLLAASSGHAEAVQMLLSCGADLTAVDKDDKTSVFWCAEQGNDDALEVLLGAEGCRDLVDVSDRYDNSPLHEAARRGYLAVLRRLLAAGSLIDNKNEDEETALHIAAEAGQVKVVRELVQRYKFLLSDENEESNTPLHLACLAGHVDVVKVLLEAGADVDARNSSLWTPLDCAAARGHVLCVSWLLDYDSPLDPLDKTKTTPLQLAAREGHVAVTRLLLEKGASLAACDSTGRNALEQAIAAGKREVCLAIVKSAEWETAMRNIRTGFKGNRLTPLRMLIKKFPDVAETVLDRCTSTNGMDTDDPKFSVSFNFELVDDMYTLVQEDDSTSLASSTYHSSPFDHEGALLDDAEPYTTDSRQLKKHHPLMLMVRHKRLNLLAHPVSISLVKHKWMSFGRFIYYSTLAFYTVFLIFLTSYVLKAYDWKWVEREWNQTSPAVATSLAASGLNSQTCQEAEEALGLQQDMFSIVCKWAILGMVVINLLREVFQMYQARLNYIGLENFIEWCCYVTAALLVWDFSPCITRQAWQWQVGAVSTFLAWMNLLLFIRKFPFLGIYVVMFTDIFATFLRFFLVFLLFIVAFALSFYMLLKEQDPFITPSRSLLKTTVMMIGEMEFDTIFEGPLDYPAVTYLLFVFFLILMTILIMNLLVGLAVDDIKAVQDQAILKRLAMQTQLVLDVEVLIPEVVRRRYMVGSKAVHPNARHSFLSRMFGDLQLLKSFNFDTDTEEMNEQESLKNDVAKLMRAVDSLRSQNQRLHAILLSLSAVAGEDRDPSEPNLAKYVW